MGVLPKFPRESPVFCRLFFSDVMLLLLEITSRHQINRMLSSIQSGRRYVYLLFTLLHRSKYLLISSHCLLFHPPTSIPPSFGGRRYPLFNHSLFSASHLPGDILTHLPYFPCFSFFSFLFLSTLLRNIYKSPPSGLHARTTGTPYIRAFPF